MVGGDWGVSGGSSARMCEVDEKGRVEENKGKKLKRHREQRDVGAIKRVSCVFIMDADRERKEVAELIVMQERKSLLASSARRSSHQELLRLRSPHFYI